MSIPILYRPKVINCIKRARREFTILVMVLPDSMTEEELKQQLVSRLGQLGVKDQLKVDPQLISVNFAVNYTHTLVLILNYNLQYRKLDRDC